MIYPVASAEYREFLSTWPLLPYGDVHEPSPSDCSQ